MLQVQVFFNRGSAVTGNWHWESGDTENELGKMGMQWEWECFCEKERKRELETGNGNAFVEKGGGMETQNSFALC